MQVMSGPEIPLDPLATALPFALILFAAIWTANSRLSKAVKRLVYAALTLRILGTFGRYYMVTVMYDNTGDSFRYFDWGVRYSEFLWSFDTQSLFNPDLWSGSKWWGTTFVRYVTGLVVAGSGHSFFGSFLFFSLFAFLGLVGFGIAFHRAYPELPAASYLRWIWLFPSLWFWPSAVGKEALLLMGLGLAVWGFIGKKGNTNWVLLSIGIFFIFAVRVQVAAVFVVSLIMAHWLSLGGRWTLGRVVQGAGIIVIGLFTLQLAMEQMGVETFDVDGVTTYLEDNTGRGEGRADGEERRGRGSAIEGATVGLAGIPTALVNILFRPFPWEARNVQLLITSFEILAFWCIVVYRRDRFFAAVRHWRSDRLLRLAVPFIFFYSISLGMLLANMGLIARQRIFIFPFLFLLVEALPRAAALRTRRGQSHLAPPVPTARRPVPRTIRSA
jgi:hypothetical protein